MKCNYKKTKISEVLAPYLPITIYDFTNTISYPTQSQVECLIDTGYDGYLMIPLTLFDQLKLISSELPPDQIRVAETIVGERFELRTALGNVKIKGINELILIEIDTYPNCAEILIGRQLLEKIIIKLDGINRLLFLEE
ncbi:MAG: hypothetical protein ACTSX4_06135 [Candidatus Helarchaeota archaeon]